MGIPEPPVSLAPVLAWTLLGVLFLIALLDAWLAYYPDRQTVTSYLRQIAGTHPILPVLIGIVIGHLFWGERK